MRTPSLASDARAPGAFPNLRGRSPARGEHRRRWLGTSCMLAVAEGSRTDSRPAQARPSPTQSICLSPPSRGQAALPEDLETTWNVMREQMRAEVTDFIFHVWIEPLEPAA